MSFCPCNSFRPFVSCCEPLITGKQPAATAEALMRSRFCAYVFKKPLYLKNTYAAKQRKKVHLRNIQKGMLGVEWVDLQITSILNGRAKDATGEVEFIATYKTNEGTRQMTERSFFIRENSLWRYVGPVQKK